MNIQAINAQNFGAKKFRLPVKSMMVGDIDTGLFAYKKVSLVKEYENPNAEALYKQAQKAKNLKEKIRLFDEMGEYRLIDTSLKAKLEKLYNEIMARIM